jgi:hypothetical protein
MSTFFSEHLMDKNLCSHEQIIEALLEQMRLLPSVASLLYERKLLTAVDLYQILNNQQRHQLDFCSSAKNLGLWNKFLEEKLAKIVQEQQKPLGEILVEKGVLTLEQLNEAFVSYAETYAGAKDKPQKEKQLNPVLLKIYLSSFYQKFSPQTKLLIEQIEQLQQDERNPKELSETFHNHMSRLLELFVQLRAETVFLGEEESQQATQSTVQLLRLMMETKTPIEIPTIVSLLKSSWEILNALCHALSLRHQIEEI